MVNYHRLYWRHNKFTFILAHGFVYSKRSVAGPVLFSVNKRYSKRGPRKAAFYTAFMKNEAEKGKGA